MAASKPVLTDLPVPGRTGTDAVVVGAAAVVEAAIVVVGIAVRLHVGTVKVSVSKVTAPVWVRARP